MWAVSYFVYEYDQHMQCHNVLMKLIVLDT